MYVFLENNIVLPNYDILIAMEYSSVTLELNTFFLESRENIVLTKNQIKSIIITENFVYLSGYGISTIYNRMLEFSKTITKK